MSIRLVELGRSSNLHYTMHLLQPLDVAVFGPLKAARRTTLQQTNCGRASVPEPAGMLHGDAEEKTSITVKLGGTCTVECTVASARLFRKIRSKYALTSVRLNLHFIVKH